MAFVADNAERLRRSLNASTSGAEVQAAWNVTEHGNMTAEQVAEEEANVKYAVLIFYAVLVVMLGAQTGLFWWKRKHKRSYELVTLLGLWLVPPMISFHLSFWRFGAVWAVYSGVTMYMISLCINVRQLAKTTPSRVYSWFMATHKVSVAAGLAGYLLLIVEMSGLGVLLRPLLAPTTALVLLWYGLYFGILGRDAAEVASDRMAVVMGTRRSLSVSLKDCGICGSELADYRRHVGGGGLGDNGGPGRAVAAAAEQAASVQLACKHLFHPSCIKGWTLVGKKDVCPVCMEKVDLRALYADRAWSTSNLTWIQMLDAVRYMIVWNPIILFGLHLTLLMFGVKPHALGDTSHGGSAANSTLGANGTALVLNLSSAAVNASTKLTAAAVNASARLTTQ